MTTAKVLQGDCLEVLLPEPLKDCWATPDWLFNELDRTFGPFNVDAAASDENAKCLAYFDREADALKHDWQGRVFCNPPYRNIIRWVRKAREETLSGRADLVCLLLPAQTSTDWFHDYVLPFAQIVWLKRKVKFVGAKWNAIMPSVVVVFRSPEVPA